VLVNGSETEPFQVAVASEEWIATEASEFTAGAAVAFKAEDIDDLGEGPLDQLLRDHPLYADMSGDGEVTTEPELTTVNGMEAAAATVEIPLGPSGDIPGIISLILTRFEDRYLLIAVAATVEEIDAQQVWLEGIVNSATLRPPAPLAAEGSVGHGEVVSGEIVPHMSQAWVLHGGAGEAFHIVVAPDEAFDVMVDVVDGDGDSIVDGGVVDGEGSGIAETASVTLPDGGDYLIVVRGYQGSAGSYTVEVNYHEGGPQDGVSQELPPFEPLSLENPAGCGGSSRIERVYAWDRYGVDFVLCQADAAFLTKLAMPAFGIASDEQLNATGGSGDLLTAPMGTGPFYVQEWDQGDRVVFGRHDTYWDELARAQTLIFQFTEAAGRLEALQSGEADGIDEPDNADAVIHDAALQLIGRPPSSTVILTLNSRLAPLDDARVRQAIALGIDRARIVDVYGGANTAPASHITPCEYESGCGGEPFEFDPDKGRELLAEAGYPDGLTVSLIIAEEVYHADSWHNAVRDELSSNLGIEVIVETLPWEELLAGYQAGELPGLSTMAWGPTYPHTAGQLDAVFWAEPNSTDFPQIVSALSDAEQASAAEKDERFGEVNDLIHELVPVVPLFHVGSTVAYRADVEGAHGSLAGAEEFSWMDPGGRDVLVWMQNDEPSTLYCADAGDWDDLRACSQVMETLVTFDGPGPAIRPGLAHGWDVSEDGLKYTFYLREGVTFHDGTLFDAMTWC
jgi:peptide/nickel transport system substrate-binding protein